MDLITFSLIFSSSSVGLTQGSPDNRKASVAAIHPAIEVITVAPLTTATAVPQLWQQLPRAKTATAAPAVVLTTAAGVRMTLPPPSSTSQSCPAATLGITTDSSATAVASLVTFPSARQPTGAQLGSGAQVLTVPAGSVRAVEAAGPIIAAVTPPAPATLEGRGPIIAAVTPPASATTLRTKILAKPTAIVLAAPPPTTKAAAVALQGILVQTTRITEPTAAEKFPELSGAVIESSADVLVTEAKATAVCKTGVPTFQEATPGAKMSATVAAVVNALVPAGNAEESEESEANEEIEESEANEGIEESEANEEIEESEATYHRQDFNKIKKI
jgi:hypothetical protein